MCSVCLVCSVENNDRACCCFCFHLRTNHLRANQKWVLHTVASAESARPVVAVCSAFSADSAL